jgi:uncharacterized SAM-binding protein YcdF (DUF218 family)
MRILRVLGLLWLLVLGLSAFTGLAGALAAWMGGPARLEPAQAIVVLARGGLDAEGILSAPSARRAIHGIALYRRGLAPALVFSGGEPEPGAGGWPPAGEAAARAELARRAGIPADAVWLAAGGRTTRGEAGEVHRLLEPRGIQRILLVADPVDMTRTRATFERAGFVVLPSPTPAADPGAPEARLALLRDVVIEVVGLVYYRLAGYA